MSKLDNVIDLSQLSSTTDDFIVSCLRERFLKDSTYTRVGSSAIVAVNPHKYVASSSDTVLVSYAQEHRDTSATKIYKEPHVFQLANNAYYNMRRTGQDQCILLMLVVFPCPPLPHTTAPPSSAQGRLRSYLLPTHPLWVLCRPNSESHSHALIDR
jgi:hypothetical protein